MSYEIKYDAGQGIETTYITVTADEELEKEIAFNEEIGREIISVEPVSNDLAAAINRKRMCGF